MKNLLVQSITLVALIFGFRPMPTPAQEPPPPGQNLQKVFPKKPPHSPYVDRQFPERVYWCDTHLHTSFSMDAGAFGCRLTPEDA